MSSEISTINKIIHLKCKECGENKTLEQYYKHNEGFMGVLGRCKNCIKSGRKTEKELYMARVRDKKRYTENIERRKYVMESSHERRKRKGYGKIHSRTWNRIKTLGIRPNICSVCNTIPINKRIEAHHFDYEKWNEVVFCCSICHSKLDMKKIEPKEERIVRF